MPVAQLAVMWREKENEKQKAQTEKQPEECYSDHDDSEGDERDRCNGYSSDNHYSNNHSNSRNHNHGTHEQAAKMCNWGDASYGPDKWEEQSEWRWSIGDGLKGMII